MQDVLHLLCNNPMFHLRCLLTYLPSREGFIQRFLSVVDRAAELRVRTLKSLSTVEHQATNIAYRADCRRLKPTSQPPGWAASN